MIAAALEREIDVIGELELAWRALPNRFLAVTGTNGKTTTVELLGHIFRGAGEPVAVAGNVGVPVAGLVGEVDPEATIVCEASSFQLEDTTLFSPEGAVFLNLAPDHLDRHGDLPAYLDAKLRVFANQGNDDVAVWNGDDPELAGVDLGGCARRVEFCRGASPDCEVAAAQGTIFWDGEPLLATSELGIPGEHNVENAMAAAAAALDHGHRRRRRPRRAAQLRRRAAPARAGRRGRRRPLRQRLQGDQRRLRRGRHRQLRPRRPRDPRRQRQGRAVRPAARAARRARRRRLPDRRHRRPDGRRTGAARRFRRRDDPRRRTSTTRSAAPPRPPPPARSSCSRRPAPATTPSPTSKPAASASARSSPSSGRSADERPRRRARPGAPREGEEAQEVEGPRRLHRVQPAADGDALPARLRRGDGLLRLLDHPGPAERRPRRLGLLPAAHADRRRVRPRDHALHRPLRARRRSAG